MKPTIVYKLNGPHRGPKGTTYDYKGVSDYKTLLNHISCGWFHTLEEAIAGESRAPEPEPEIEGADDTIEEEIVSPPKPKRKRRTKAEIEADNAVQ